MTSPPPPPPTKERPPYYGGKPQGCSWAVIAVVIMAVTGVTIVATVQLTQWGMQASGWNCAWRKWGEAQGWKQDVPAAQSEYCRGHQ